jgi:hypothetical protein
LNASSTTSHAIPAQSFIAAHPFAVERPSASARGGIQSVGQRARGELHAVDAATVHARHFERAVLDLGGVADDGDPLERRHEESPDSVVDVPFGHADPGAVEHLVGAELTREHDSVRETNDSGAGAVVLVEHLADDLLDEVFERDDAGRAAVLVDDDRHLIALRAQLRHDGIQVHRFGHPQGLLGDRSRGDVSAAVPRHAHRLLEMCDARDVVHRLVVDREPAVPRAARELDDVLHAVAGGDRVDRRARRHDVGRRESGEGQGAVEQRCGVLFEDARARGASDEAREFLRRRAPDSSSLGSIPMPRRMPLALPFKTAIAGRNTVVKPTWKGITSFAVCRGIASAKFFGTSSPRIIENIVAMAIATTVEIARPAASGIPHAVNSGLSRFESAGSIV